MVINIGSRRYVTHHVPRSNPLEEGSLSTLIMFTRDVIHRYWKASLEFSFKIIVGELHIYIHK